MIRSKRIRDEELPAADVLEQQGYAAWVRAVNGQAPLPSDREPVDGRVENFTPVPGFVQA